MDRICVPMNKNRIKGVADQGERVAFREALVMKGGGVDPADTPKAPLTPGVLHILLMLGAGERHENAIMKQMEADCQGGGKMGRGCSMEPLVG